MLLADKLIFADIKYNTQFSLNYQLKESFYKPSNQRYYFYPLYQANKPWHDWALGLSCITSLYGGKKCFAMEEYGVAETEQ